MTGGVILAAGAGRRFGAVKQPAEPLVCDDWEEGMAAPLRAGIGELDARGAGAAVITLGDQPFITPQVIAGVVDHAGPGWQAVRATYAGRPGHPVLIDRSLFPAVAALRGDVGARELLATARVRLWECGRLGRDDDIDTPDQLEAARP